MSLFPDLMFTFTETLELLTLGHWMNVPTSFRFHPCRLIVLAQPTSMFGEYQTPPFPTLVPASPPCAYFRLGSSLRSSPLRALPLYMLFLHTTIHNFGRAWDKSLTIWIVSRWRPTVESSSLTLTIWIVSPLTGPTGPRPRNLGRVDGGLIVESSAGSPSPYE